VVLNFENADLREVIRTFSELLGINYILPTGAQGTVTIHTAGELDRGELFTVFFQILEANGLTAVEEDGLYKILPVGEAGRMPISASVGKQAAGLPSGRRMLMQIIPLEFISADEMTKILTPFISANGTIVSHPDSNTLLLVDREPGVQKALQLVEAFDVDLFDQVVYRFYPARYLPPKELTGLLDQVFSAFGGEEQSRLKLIPIERLNKILALSPDQAAFDRLEDFLSQLDVPVDSLAPRIFIYPVRNGSAEELAELLSTVFSGGEPEKAASPAEPEDETPETETPERPEAPENPFERPQTDSGREAAAGSNVRSASGGAATLQGRMTITPDPKRNTLIIEALPSDYQIIKGILEKIDILPRQVLIEVLIAEISLDGQEELGVEWTYEKGAGELSTSLLNANAGSGGLQFAVGKLDRWTAALSALASENKLNVLSRPTVLASDNKEARINVSTQVPVASAQYLFDSGPQGVTQTNIQYRDTGIILSVTPHISDTGMVSMEISQEVSETGDGVNVGGQNFPSFRERKVNTTLTVGDEQTIFIGGLMRERTSKGNAGVPYLSRIPILGFLFGRDTSESEKSELILLITPYVITDAATVEAVTEEFSSKVHSIRENIQNEPGVFPPIP
jgi:general secretion pathway protein D